MADTPVEFAGNELTTDERLAAMQAEYERTAGALNAASKQVADLNTMLRQQEGYMAALRDLGASKGEAEELPVTEEE